MKQVSNLLIEALVFGLRQLAQLALGVFAFLMIALLLSLLSGCSNGNPSVKKQVSEYETRIESELTVLENNINVLKARIDHAGRELRVEWFREIDDLELQKRALNAKLRELRSANVETLEKVKADIDRLLDGESDVVLSQN